MLRTCALLLRPVRPVPLSRTPCRAASAFHRQFVAQASPERDVNVRVFTDYTVYKVAITQPPIRVAAPCSRYAHTPAHARTHTLPRAVQGCRGDKGDQAHLGACRSLWQRPEPGQERHRAIGVCQPPGRGRARVRLGQQGGESKCFTLQVPAPPCRGAAAARAPQPPTRRRPPGSCLPAPLQNFGLNPTECAQLLGAFESGAEATFFHDPQKGSRRAPRPASLPCPAAPSCRPPPAHVPPARDPNRPPRPPPNPHTLDTTRTHTAAPPPRSGEGQVTKQLRATLAGGNTGDWFLNLLVNKAGGGQARLGVAVSAAEQRVIRTLLEASRGIRAGTVVGRHAVRRGGAGPGPVRRSGRTGALAGGRRPA
jgi:hypothetical protein